MKENCLIKTEPTVNSLKKKIKHLQVNFLFNCIYTLRKFVSPFPSPTKYIHVPTINRKYIPLLHHHIIMEKAYVDNVFMLPNPLVFIEII